MFTHTENPQRSRFPKLRPQTRTLAHIERGIPRDRLCSIFPRGLDRILYCQNHYVVLL